MSMLKLKNNTSRNAFDLSRKNAFTAKVGELLPVACLECIPGDSVKGYVQHFTRTTPVNTAAYTRLREYYDWFFVPTNLLWNKFNTFVTQMVDNNQHAMSITDSQVLTNQHPYFTCNQLATYVASMSKQENSFGFSRAKQTAKLLEYLGYGNFWDSADNGTAQVFRKNALLNPFPLLAYQKIYQDYYRNSQWENAYSPAFNIDYISGAVSSLNIPVSQISQSSENMFDLRYANWNKDLFMGVLPNAQYGKASIVSGGLDGFANVVMKLTNGSDATLPPENIQLKTGTVNGSYSNYRNIFLDSSSAARLGISSNDLVGLTSQFSILALRQAEALQKWQEITQSQQQDYKNQIEAHFGVSMSDAYSERCMYVDGSVSSLDISEVTNTNITSDNPADIAGKGVGVGDGKFNFKSDVHGYLICIYHAVPLLDYASDGISKLNLKSYVTDYAIPEFDKTGMVQVSTVELTNRISPQTYAPDLLGYAPRYYDYKTSIDEVHGAFKNGGLGAWVAPIDNSYLSKYFAIAGVGAVKYKFFKINPSVLNPIFAQDVDSDTTTDQLLVNANFDINAVRNLDRDGLPY